VSTSISTLAADPSRWRTRKWTPSSSARTSGRVTAVPAGEQVTMASASSGRSGATGPASTVGMGTGLPNETGGTTPGGSDGGAAQPAIRDEPRFSARVCRVPSARSRRSRVSGRPSGSETESPRSIASPARPTTGMDTDGEIGMPVPISAAAPGAVEWSTCSRAESRSRSHSPRPVASQAMASRSRPAGTERHVTGIPSDGGYTSTRS
jgi:hypothetical protein